MSAEYTKIKTARTIICDFCNQLYPDDPCEPADCDWLRMLEEDAADVAPVRHGRWEYIPQTINTLSRSSCSVCGWWTLDPSVDGAYNYCPCCGARMDDAE